MTGALRWLIGGVVAASIPTDPARAVEAPYFPPLVFEKDHEGQHEFRAAWYGKQLKAMNEPSLWWRALNDRHGEVYRFLWLPSFHHPISVRVERTDDVVTLTAVAMSGAGGYRPGHPLRRRVKRLKVEDWEWLLVRVERARFWRMPTERKANDDGVGLDGDQIIVEGVREGRYHVVDRWESESKAYTELCRWMLELSGFKQVNVWTDEYGH